jgi:hypothetical protein
MTTKQTRDEVRAVADKIASLPASEHSKMSIPTLNQLQSLLPSIGADIGTLRREAEAQGKILEEIRTALSEQFSCETVSLEQYINSMQRSATDLQANIYMMQNRHRRRNSRYRQIKLNQQRSGIAYVQTIVKQNHEDLRNLLKSLEVTNELNSAQISHTLQWSNLANCTAGILNVAVGVANLFLLYFALKMQQDRYE